MATRKARLPKGSWITLPMQDRHIRSMFPAFRGTIGRGNAVWRGTLQPQSSSPVYDIEIRYKDKRVPKVFVVTPTLAENAPHLYRDRDLCLYWPKEWRWGARQLIADTILPWSALWLFYYELWLDTGKWLGPSSHA